LYYYAVTLISLEVVLWGLIRLLRTIFSADMVGGGARLLAEALSLTLVGVPVFLLHWHLAQRSTRQDPEEHSASLRAVFLYAALLATLVPVVQNGLALLNRVLLQSFGMHPLDALIGVGQTWSDNLVAILMNGVVAAYFYTTLHRDWKVITPKDSFVGIRRLYRYIWVLYTLALMVVGVQQVLRFVFYAPSSIFAHLFRASFVNGLALLLISVPLWVYTWKTAQDALVEPAEQGSNLRLAILYILALGGVVTVLTFSGMVLDVLLRYALGEAMAWQDFINRVGGPFSLGVPLGGVWAYYGHWLNLELAGVVDSPRRAGLQRFYYSILSFIGLGATFIGLTLLLSFVVDTTFGELIWAETLRPRLAASLATLLVGLPLWWWTWYPLAVEASAAGDIGEHARRSVVRKAYLYLVLFSSVIASMVSAVALAILIFRTLLGDPPPSFAQNVGNALQMLFLLGIIGSYHGQALRRDSKMAAHALAAKHALFPVLIYEPGDGAFAQAILAAIQKQTP
ncbi:MAG: DUF5671 domain-containing protein, partial [Anaerolineaceae bacterium]|nr:DUF5671 domain-containing protein [Anaerolineaceae bacterium]